MPLKIKNKIENELARYISRLKKDVALNNISPTLFNYIGEFISRPGKRVRPVLFVIGYLGFGNKTPAGLYASAVSIELLHDFMLVHDDIIDKSDTRRGKPSMHKMFNNYLAGCRSLKFNGQDLAIVAGDVMFAMSLEAFLAIKENPARKEKALRQLIKAALYTGAGEFIELAYGAVGLEAIKRPDIYKIYDYKTAYYSFASPLALGAILAGAKKQEVEKLIRYGICLGRAFQIKDDILGVFGSQEQTGKSGLCDLQEAKKTILIWFAAQQAPKKDRLAMRKILAQKKTNQSDLNRMRRILVKSGALEYARGEVLSAIKKAQAIIASSKIRLKYKNLLQDYSEKILELE